MPQMEAAMRTIWIQIGMTGLVLIAISIAVENQIQAVGALIAGIAIGAWK